MKPTSLSTIKKEFAMYLEEHGMTDLSPQQVQLIETIHPGLHLAIRSETTQATLKAISASLLHDLHSKQGFQVIIVTSSDERTVSLKKGLAKLFKGKNLSLAALQDAELSKDIAKAKENHFHVLIASFAAIDNLMHRKHLKAGSVKAIIFSDVQDYMDSPEMLSRSIDILQLIPPVATRIAHTKVVTDTVKEFFDYVLQEYTTIVDDASGTEVLSQERFLCSEENKDKFFLSYCKKIAEQRTLILARDRFSKERLVELLEHEGFSVGTVTNEDVGRDIHALKEFQKAMTSFFVISDEDSCPLLQKIKIDCIVNYDVPSSKEQYITRLTTANLAKRPKVCTFVDEQDEDIFVDIVFYYLYDVLDLDDIYNSLILLVFFFLLFYSDMLFLQSKHFILLIYLLICGWKKRS